MVEWLTVSQICKKLDMPETTVRRYIQRFDSFIRTEKYNHITKYGPEILNVFVRAYELYNEKLTTEEVREHLEKEFSLQIDVVEDENHHTTTTDITPSQQNLQKLEQVEGIIRDMNQRIGELEQKIDKQTDYIEQKLEQRDKKLMEEIRGRQQEKEAKKKTLINRIINVFSRNE